MSEKETLLDYARKLPELLDQIYRTPTDPGQWDGLLSGLVEASASRSARLLVMDRSASSVHFSTKVNIDDDQHRDYVSHFVNLCPWRPELAEKEPGRLYNTFHEFSCKQQAFYRTEFFNDWARHLDIEHGLCGTVYSDSRYTVQLLLQRTGGQGAFPMSLTREINRLVPHVRQALHLSRAFSVQQQENLSVMSAAQRAFMPFMLLNREGEVIYTCPRTDSVLDSQPAIAIRQGRLWVQCRQARQQLSREICRASIDPSYVSEPVLVFRRGCPVPVRLLVEPLGMPDIPRFWTEDAMVAVYLQDPQDHLDLDEGLMERLFGLTGAEARVGAGLALGKDIQAMADEAGVTVNTVRTQLKSVMAKTGTRRQAELVGLLLRSSAVRGVNQGQVPVTGL